MSTPDVTPGPTTSKKAHRWPRFAQVMGVLNDFSDLADVVSRIQGKPRGKDWFAITMKSGSVGLNLYNRAIEFRRRAANKTIESGWAMYADMNTVLMSLRRAGRVSPDRDRPVHAGLTPYLLDGIYPLLWNTNMDPSGFMLRTSESSEIRRIARDFIWSKGSVVTNLTPFFTVEKPSGIARECERTFAERVRQYYDAGVRRTFLLTGLPGTGKSQSAIRVAYDMQLRGFLGDASTLTSTNSFWCAGSIGADVLIVDDLDWSTPADIAESLSTLVNLRNVAKLIFITANRVDNLPSPMLRPGRIDEIIEWPGCTVDEVTALGAPSGCEGWPIAFVQEACTRLKVEGHADLREIAQRIGEDPVRRAPDLRTDISNEPVLIDSVWSGGNGVSRGSGEVP